MAPPCHQCIIICDTTFRQAKKEMAEKTKKGVQPSLPFFLPLVRALIYISEQLFAQSTLLFFFFTIFYFFCSRFDRKCVCELIVKNVENQHGKAVDNISNKPWLVFPLINDANAKKLLLHMLMDRRNEHFLPSLLFPLFPSFHSFCFLFQ